MDELLNILQNFGFPVMIVFWFISYGQKTLNDLACGINKMGETMTKMQLSMENMVSRIETSNQEETKQVLEWMYKHEKNIRRKTKK